MLPFSAMVVGFMILSAYSIELVTQNFYAEYQRVGYFRTVMRSDDEAAKRRLIEAMGEVQIPDEVENAVELLNGIWRDGDYSPELRLAALDSVGVIARSLTTSLEAWEETGQATGRWEADVLATLRDEAAPELLDGMGKGDSEYDEAALLAVGMMQDRKQIDRFTALLETADVTSPSWSIAVVSLGYMRSIKSLGPLVKAAPRVEDAKLASLLAWAVARISKIYPIDPDEDAPEVFNSLVDIYGSILEKGNLGQRCAAAEVFRYVGDADIATHLFAAFDKATPEEMCRSYAVGIRRTAPTFVGSEAKLRMAVLYAFRQIGKGHAEVWKWAEERAQADDLDDVMNGHLKNSPRALGGVENPLEVAMVTLFKNAAQIVSNAGVGQGDLGVVYNAAFLVGEKGLVEWIGPQAELPRDVSPANTVDLGQRVVLPGMVECHTHLVFAGDRTQDYSDRCAGVSYEEVARRGGGIRLSVRETRKASKEELLALGRDRLRQFLELGVTTVEIKSGYGLSLEDELKCLEVIQELAEEVLSAWSPPFSVRILFPTNMPTAVAITCALTEELLPEVSARGLASFVDVFCEVGAYTLSETRSIFEKARALGLGIKIHAEQLSHTGATSLAAEFGAVSADHLEHITADDVAALKRSGTVAVLLPGAGLFLGGHTRPPARKLLDSGVTVALSTDFNPGTCPSVHLPLMTTLGCSWLGMAPEEAIQGVTTSAAKALALDDGRGTLRPGAPADFSVHPIDSWMEIPYLFGRNTASQVYIAGNRVR